MLLSRLAQSKDNNFNIIRFIAASAVLFGHSFALLRQPEPLVQSLGMSIGAISVDLFFVTSGFLVTGSLLSRKSISEYFWSRVLRIYPALIMMSLVTVFGLGVFFTSLPLKLYFQHPDTYSFLVKCSTVIGGISFYLPGVFENNPYKGAVNGSLWSLVYEVKMYVVLALLWSVCGIRNNQRSKFVGYVIFINIVIAGILLIWRRFHDFEESLLLRTDFMFFMGATFWVLKDKVYLSFRILVPIVVGLAISALISHDVLFVAYQLTAAYILIYLAFVPAGIIRKFNALGDISYGMYIYAFPVQQSLIALIPGISIFQLTTLSFGITVCFAYASWHLLERRVLYLKGKLFQQERRSEPKKLAQ
ncbi:acyltransferase family protein [Undibacterium sp. Ji50W]|uniref:acyltransferase family protein n=1 Tax=Undibacterium sp. Ji50W TaxID=3413041 RepID=UPI003BF0A21F